MHLLGNNYIWQQVCMFRFLYHCVVLCMLLCVNVYWTTATSFAGRWSTRLIADSSETLLTEFLAGVYTDTCWASLHLGDRDSVLSARRWRRDLPGPSRPVLEPTQSPTQSEPGLFLGGKAAKACRWPRTPSSTRLNMGIAILPHLCAYSADTATTLPLYSLELVRVGTTRDVLQSS